MGQRRHDDVQATGERVDSLLEQLRSTGDQRVAELAEELVAALVQLYGEGLARMMRALTDPGPADDGVLRRLVADPLVESLLVLHDLHPDDVDTRIQAALDEVRPYLGSHAGDVEYRGVDGDGVVHLRLQGSCSGCPSSEVTVRTTIERAVLDAAPETASVQVEGLVEAPPPGPKLLRIGRRPPDPDAALPAFAVDSDGWAHLTGLPRDDPGRWAALLGGQRVVLCRTGGKQYAYRDGCPDCGASLAAGELSGITLRCAGCGQRFDIHHAGVGLDQPLLRLSPLPLLPDGAGVRVAVAVTGSGPDSAGVADPVGTAGVAGSAGVAGPAGSVAAASSIGVRR